MLCRRGAENHTSQKSLSYVFWLKFAKKNFAKCGKRRTRSNHYSVEAATGRDEFGRHFLRITCIPR
jgi:hypothetical protein